MLPFCALSIVPRELVLFLIRFSIRLFSFFVLLILAQMVQCGNSTLLPTDYL